MPRDDSIKKILIIGSGPIVIGQGCEFDYSGVQACRALKEDGYYIILINSNPATIMTDPEFADRTYIEPLTPEFVEKIIEIEKPDAILPTLGGQTALNLALELEENGILNKHKVNLIGANAQAIQKGEDRELFKQAMIKIGLDLPVSGVVHDMDEAHKVLEKIGKFPLIIRPAFTLGGTGGGIAYNKEDFENIVSNGLKLSPKSEVLIEESLIGWKEFEMEVIRDKADNCIVICSIENIDPMGIHTGDSITVAPIQTLTDKEYQYMRDSSFAVIREIGVETGGSNIQFAVDPKTGRQVVIEMNPRVSRSSALASKATGFPIARIAAKLAVGYTLDEIPNDITKETMAAFEPSIDYCVVKIPRFTFEKFPEADKILTTQMKSVGETMAIGSTFSQALQKAIRSLDIGYDGLGFNKKDDDLDLIRNEIPDKLIKPKTDRLFIIDYVFKNKYNQKPRFTIEEVHEMTNIDMWFLQQIQKISLAEEKVMNDFSKAKKLGFSDSQIAYFKKTSEENVRKSRKEEGVIPTYNLVDSCAAEFEAYTPYFYSSYGELDESFKDKSKKKIIILGGGPNRIGQGIEFDYCCVHACYALQELGYETIMVNSNPETVSTDYDTSDKLYFEPLTLEDVLNICDKENPYGVIVQFGGQTPLNLADDLEKNGINILGTKPESINLAEDRKLFSKLLDEISLKQAPSFTTLNIDGAVDIARNIGYPVLVRPSFVLGGRSMAIVYNEEELGKYVATYHMENPNSKHPILIDKFLESSIEVDVDCISDGKKTVVGAIMEHVEQAGIHSGDSACVIPSFSLNETVKNEIRNAAIKLAKALNVVGLMNIQFAVQNDEVYVIEANPRASRTVPYVSKTIGVPLAKLATKVMVGETLENLGFVKEIIPNHYTVKEAIFPFFRFPGVDISLSPEMKSTGEVMGIDEDFGQAFRKSQIAAYTPIPQITLSLKSKGSKHEKSGNILISISDSFHNEIKEYISKIKKFGFDVFYTKDEKSKNMSNEEFVGKKFKLLVSIHIGETLNDYERHIRTLSIANNIPVTTTVRGFGCVIKAIESSIDGKIKIKALQDYY